MKSNSNPLICDTATGMCAMPAVKENDSTAAPPQSSHKLIHVIYYTDPICSSCWGIEPQLRKLKLEYGEFIDIEYRMGGLLPDWSYNSGGISKPSDVAHHWDEVSGIYDMPIDGDVWLEDPLNSSYPPSIAFKAAQMQDKEKAIRFLRVIREMVFLRKLNITKWEHLLAAADQVGLQPAQLKIDFEGKAKLLFQEDLKLGRELGVRGFPSLFLMDKKGNTEFVYGAKPHAIYEAAILKLAPGVQKTDYKKDWQAIFAVYPTLTAREFSELSGTHRDESEKLLNGWVAAGHLERQSTKNGSLWKLK